MVLDHGWPPVIPLLAKPVRCLTASVGGAAAGNEGADCGEGRLPISQRHAILVNRLWTRQQRLRVWHSHSSGEVRDSRQRSHVGRCGEVTGCDG